MPDQDVITVRATDQTPRDLLHLDGRTYPVRPTVPTPAPGCRGLLHGIPGVMAEDGRTWEITSDRPLPQSQHTGVQLGDLLTVLVEIRDLLRDRLAAPNTSIVYDPADPQVVEWIRQAANAAGVDTRG